MQYRIYDRQTLAYQDGGAVRDFNIDSDYINDNNSVIDIVTSTNAKIGDIICLIETSGAYDRGVVTAVDNEALTINYKHDKELFNDNILNPFASEFKDDTDIQVAGKFGINVIGELIDLYWGRTLDSFKKLRLKITYNGDVLDENGNPRMLWTWDNTEIKFKDWLVEIFEKYSVVLSWDIEFNTAEFDLTKRNPYYVITLSCVINKNEIIKDNVESQKITYKTELEPESTVCYVINKNTTDIMYISSGRNLFDATYGYEDSYLDDFDGVVYDVAKTDLYYKQESNVSSYIKVNPNTNYVLSMENGNNIKRQICFYNSNKEYLTALADDGYTGTEQRFSYSFDTNGMDTVKFIRICYNKYAKKIQLEEGSTATPYDPFNKKAIYYLAFNSDTRVSDGYYAPENTKFYADPECTNEISTLTYPVNVLKNNNGGFEGEIGNTYNIGENDLNEYFTGYTPYYLQEEPLLDTSVLNVIRNYPDDVKLKELQNNEWVGLTRTYYTTGNYVASSFISSAALHKVVYKSKNHTFTPSYKVYFKAEDCKYNGFYVTMDSTDSNRVLPIKTKYIEYDSESTATTTVEDAASNELKPNSLNQAIEIEIPKDTKMFNFELANYGDIYKIITKNGTISSVYSGRKESSNNNVITLLFGLGRKNYTDLIQKGFKQQKYKVTYR